MADRVAGAPEGVVDVLRCIDSVVEDQGFGPLGQLFVRPHQLAKHLLVSVEGVRGFNGIIPADPQFQGFQAHIVIMHVSLGKEFLFDERSDGFPYNELFVMVLHRELDVGTQRGCSNPEDDRLFEILEELSERIIMCLVDNYQTDPLQGDCFFLQAVVKGFHHGHKALEVFIFIQLLYLTVDDLVVNSETFEHARSL